MLTLGSAACRHRASEPSQGAAGDSAYVMPNTLQVVDAPGEIRLSVETLRAGDRVRVLQRTHNWDKVKLPDGRTGWVESKDLVDAQSYEASQKLLKDLAHLSAQAVGHAPQSINLRIEPSRDSAALAQLPNNQKLEIFGRKLVTRASQPDRTTAAPAKEAWYLVRADQRAGWVLGRSVSLDIPAPLGANAQGYNMVAWLVLNTVADGDRQVPQYVAADRGASQEADFTHIRVFTWWAKNQQYVTSYAESGLVGYFPIRVVQVGKVPNFRLNLVDKQGNKVQKVYALYNTITRPLGLVDGWEGNAAPTRPPSARVRRR